MFVGLLALKNAQTMGVTKPSIEARLHTAMHKTIRRQILQNFKLVIMLFTPTFKAQFFILI